jgi:hypothetical protein
MIDYDARECVCTVTLLTNNRNRTRAAHGNAARRVRL